ncbi:MAG: sigma-70 family RNA polymerase sigma factor [Planctomycetes bacterium]|nr:sigma-70 family RNA polymerase sigma factor [Planctomycetota bacterium]
MTTPPAFFVGTLRKDALLPQHGPEDADHLAANSDSALVSLARKGAREAFAVLVRRYVRLVVAVAQASVGAQDAEDMAQDVFAEAWRSLDMLRSPEYFKAWLVGITRHMCIYRLRRRIREEEVYSEFSDIQKAASAGESDATPAAEHRESISLLNSAVEHLPETYRRVVLMRYMAGLSVDEIAQALGITRAACDKRLTRAKQRLKDMLKDTIIGDS